ncbi:MAG: aldehyde dehydrogenase family protein [Burkholderiaceae bacterium]|nr:aldehyde dehydrogenase family protein [Burkholderiaceae bacterium]
MPFDRRDGAPDLGIEQEPFPPIHSAEAGTPPPAVLDAINPATREGIGGVICTAQSDLAAIVARARDAARAWGDLPSWQHAKALSRLRDLIAQRAPEIAETIARGMGKPLIEALSFEVAAVLDALDDRIAKASGVPVVATASAPASDATSSDATSSDATSSDATSSDATSSDATSSDATSTGATNTGQNPAFQVRDTTRAVVCVIAPVSSPFELAMSPAIAALAGGNAVIVKPSSSTPLVGSMIARLFEEAFTDFPALAQVVHGTADLGSQLATAEGVDFVVFIGSTRVGRKLRAALAPLLRPALFEMGGAVALIVCDDANLERAANAAVFGRFSNNGQGCANVNRVYVQRTVADAFIHKVMHKVRALKSGPYTDPFCEIGPLANGRGLQDLRAVLQDALDERAILVAGGFPAHVTGPNNGERRSARGQGWYWPPTVLAEVNDTMRVMKEAISGPILPIQAVDDDRAAIALVNDAADGSGVCVFSSDLSRAHQIVAQLRAGHAAINDLLMNSAVPSLNPGNGQHCTVHPEQSGDSRLDPGRTSSHPFSMREGLPLDDGGNAREAHWFPYSVAKLRAIEASPRKRVA